MASELSALEANRLFYADRADTYDQLEHCASAERSHQRLESLLRDAVAAAARSPSSLRALDAGGGTGNASSILVSLDVDPLLLDASPEMAALWERKALARGHPAHTAVGGVEEFLAANPDSWDLIVFSSVLHHLDDPAAVLRVAAARLAPGGVIATCFDPTALGASGRGLRRLDWACWDLVHAPRAFAGIVVARMRRTLSTQPRGPEVGRRAETHALGGLDDCVLVGTLRDCGLELLAHRRSFDARHGWARMMFRAVRAPSSFELLARNPV
jgi:SAM-dependent methyltransferase